MKMGHRHFGKAKTSVADLLDHLDTDYAAVALKLDFFKDLSPHKPKITVDIADLETKGKLCNSVINSADYRAVPGIMPFDLVSVDDIDVIAQSGDELPQLAHVILRIAIGIEDKLLSGLGYASAQCSTIAAILRVVNNTDSRETLLEKIEHLQRTSAAAVVDQDDLVVIGDLISRRDR